MSRSADDDLVDAVLDLASRDGNLPEQAKYLVLAALDGDAAMADALEGTCSPPPLRESAAEPTTKPVGAYLASITVAGFRGVGQAAR